jgi:SAM-dependent methyltransferase
MGLTDAVPAASLTVDPAALFDRFARFYDADYRHYDDDLDAILQLAGEGGGPVLELGCGTGRVLVPLAAAGHRVTGVDVSPALLARARARAGAAGVQGRVTLVQAALPGAKLPARDYALAVCTSNTLMHFASPQAQLDLLRFAADHLRDGGVLFLDLFSPDIPRLLAVEGVMELADRWVDEESGAEVLKWSVRSLDLAEQIQETTFIYEEIFAHGETRRTVCPFTLRYLWRNEGELMLRAAGFEVDDVWGDFDGAPYDALSERLIFIARKPAGK